MANRSSALKHIRADQRKRKVNFDRKSAMRKAIKKTRLAIEAGEIELATKLYRGAAGQLDRAANGGVIKKGTANRKKSRLAIGLNKLRKANSHQI